MNKIDTSYFIGTEQYFRIRPWAIVLTEGAMYVAETAGALWLMDKIGALIQRHSAQRGPAKLGDGFFVVKLTVNEDKSAKISYDDGNGNAVSLEELVLATDYPDPELTLYVQWGGQTLRWVVMVPSEY